MSDSEFVTIQGFKSFTTLWYDACEQIAQEPLKDNLDDDIKLFNILRAMVLSPEKAVFLRSHKLNDFNTIQNNRVQTTVFNKNPNHAHISWNRIPQPRPTVIKSQYKMRVAPNTPAPISYLNIGNTKIISYKNLIKLMDDCVFEQTEQYSPNDKIYTIIHDKFFATLDKTRVFYPVSREIMTMFATNQQNRINLNTFKESTDKMYKNLLTIRNKHK